MGRFEHMGEEKTRRIRLIEPAVGEEELALILVRNTR
jgi:hypothetical protein